MIDHLLNMEGVVLRFLAVFVFLLAAVSPLLAGDIVDVDEKVTGKGIKSMDVEMDLAVGQYTIASCQPGEDLLGVVTGSYDQSRFDYTLDYRDRSDRGDLYFSTESIRKHLSDWRDFENDFRFGFSPEIELRLKIDVGAAETRFDFSDLAISELDLDVGAADAEIEFPTRNRAEMRYFSIDAGACDLKVHKIGNARFRDVKFDGGVGSFLLDFTGDFDYDASADVSVGLGSVKIILPKDLGVRLELDDSWLSSVDFPEREFSRVRGDIYETDNFDSAVGRLTIYLEIGLGSAEIVFE